MTKVHLLGMSLLALVACGDDSARHTCGAGTTVTGGECVAVDAGDDNPGATCGSGTHLEGPTCVPDPAGGGAAPTIEAITPPHAGISGLTADGGGVFFEITGTGFMDPQAGTVTVTFGSVQAAIVVMDDMTIDGIIPGNTAITAPVTVSDANGNAMIAFTYDALIGAGGHGQPGDAYIIDPTNGFDLDLGPITVDDGTGSAAGVGVTGLAFDGTTLYAATTGAAGDTPELVNAVPRQIVKVDLQTAVTTIVGPAADADGTPVQISDLEINNGTIYATGYSGAGSDVPVRGYLGTVDPATGVVAYVGTGENDNGMGMAFDGSGALWFSGTGVASNGETNGFLESLDPATGSATTGPSFDFPGDNDGINAMAFESDTLYAVINDAPESTTGNSILASVDTTTGHLTLIGLIPATIDAIATPPASLAVARMAGAGSWHTTRPTQLARCAPLRAVPRMPAGQVTVTACGGETRTFTSGGRYQLVTNRRGNLKLVDRLTHRTLLRNVTSLR